MKIINEIDSVSADLGLNREGYGSDGLLVLLLPMLPFMMIRLCCCMVAHCGERVRGNPCSK